jgi:beta-glucosidase
LNLVVERGDFQVMIGSSSQDIRLKGDFEVVGEDKSTGNERVFACPVDVQQA